MQWLLTMDLTTPPPPPPDGSRQGPISRRRSQGPGYGRLSSTVSFTHHLPRCETTPTLSSTSECSRHSVPRCPSRDISCPRNSPDFDVSDEETDNEDNVKSKRRHLVDQLSSEMPACVPNRCGACLDRQTIRVYTPGCGAQRSARVVRKCPDESSIASDDVHMLVSFYVAARWSGLRGCTRSLVNVLVGTVRR